jgi:hypothetical protein
MDSEGKLKIIMLSNTNYRSWSYTMKVVLESKKLVDYIETDVEDLINLKTQELTPKLTPKPTDSGSPGVVLPGQSPESSETLPQLTPEQVKDIATATEALRNRDAKARAWIATQVSPEQLNYIISLKTAFKQWQSLKRVFEPTGNAWLGALLAAFYSYTLSTGYWIDKVATDLTTMQTDIQMLDLLKALTESSKLVQLTELFIKSNLQYKSTVLLLRAKKSILFEEAVLLLKQTQVYIKEAENSSWMLDSALFVYRTNKPFGNSNRNLNRPLNRPLPASRDTKNI